MELKTDKAKVSYIIGEDIGNSFIREGYDLDIEVMIDALRKAANGEKQNLITEEEKTQLWVLGNKKCNQRNKLKCKN